MTQEQFEDLELVPLVEHLDHEGGYDRIGQFFGKNVMRIHKTPVGNGIHLTYIEGCPCWKPKWARDVRNVIFYRNESPLPGEGHIYLAKCALQRGAEVLSSYHSQHDVQQSQDCNAGRIEKFDEEQQRVMSLLASDVDRPLPSTLSMKVDGSILIVTLVPRDHPVSRLYDPIFADELPDDIAEPHLASFEFARAWDRAAAPLELPYRVILSTSGSLVYSAKMADYLITALAGIQGVPLDPARAPAEYVAEVGPPFLRQIARAAEVLGCAAADTLTTLSFEVVCPGRKTYLGTEHLELAVSYPQGAVYFLGHRRGIGRTAGHYLPHTATPDLAPACGFVEPLSWRAETTGAVNRMLARLEAVIDGHATREEFLEEFPPLPGHRPACPELHYEGFVLYSERGNPVEYDYHKVKTVAYYRCHKYRPEHRAYLMHLATLPAARFFPLAQRVAAFHAHAATRFAAFHKRVQETLGALREHARSVCCCVPGPVPRNELWELLPARGRAKFLEMSREIQARFVVAALKGHGDNPFHQALLGAFELSEPRGDKEWRAVGATTRGLIFEMNLWDDTATGLDERWQAMTETNSPTVSVLLGLTLDLTT
eukprot:gnl/Trimastix_PCT/2391.p1 GENE.gnl/Trimastix_PCT/2391~~gnl/Trimastix_PCT/2391.p1  ORF type:complete len:605 (-),score=158.34 gnl/Trimastix_PCT/2391:135-1928(-)